MVNVASVAHLFARKGIDFDDLMSERDYDRWVAYGEFVFLNKFETFETYHSVWVSLCVLVAVLKTTTVRVCMCYITHVHVLCCATTIKHKTGQSKLANILFSYELARRLQLANNNGGGSTNNNNNITVNALHPGVVRTELPR